MLIYNKQQTNKKTQHERAIKKKTERTSKRRYINNMQLIYKLFEIARLSNQQNNFNKQKRK